MTNLSGKTLFVSGGSRGIGLAIAKRAVSYTHLTLPTTEAV